MNVPGSPSASPPAAEALYLQHYPAVHGYLRARVLDANQADDLCQEVFYRALRDLARFDATRDLRFWLLGIARNVVREYIRKVRRAREVGWTELCVELEDTVASGGLYEEFMPYLSLCVLELGESARQALNWHYMSAMKLQEIAERLGRTEGAIKLLLVRARQALRQCIESRLRGRTP